MGWVATLGLDVYSTMCSLFTFLSITQEVSPEQKEKKDFDKDLQAPLA